MYKKANQTKQSEWTRDLGKYFYRLDIVIILFTNNIFVYNCNASGYSCIESHGILIFYTNSILATWNLLCEDHGPWNDMVCTIMTTE